MLILPFVPIEAVASRGVTFAPFPTPSISGIVFIDQVVKLEAVALPTELPGVMARTKL